MPGRIRGKPVRPAPFVLVLEKIKGMQAMANEEQPTVRRTLQLRFTMPATDTTQFAAMIKAAAPFYQIFGKAEVRLLQNVDDPAKFIQEIEYEADPGWELNRQRIASDARMQVYLQTWRTMFPGALEIDVFQEV